MEINAKNIRTWSILGQRGAFGSALLASAENNEKIIGLSADLCNTSGMDRFASAYPNRFINTGIAEQNLIGIAAGIADSGYIPFATTFANFISLRACEQVRHFMGYMQSNVKMVGLGAGFAMELFGNTHYGIEDIAAIRAIPNIVILSPADGLEVIKCVQASAILEKPVYIRLTGLMNQPIVHKKDIEFRIGEAIVLKDGADVVIYATGSMVTRALLAATILEEKGICAAVVDVHTIKPIDESIIQRFSEVKLVVTIEEHSIIGGLGSVIAEALTMGLNSPPILRLGIEEGYKNAGEYEYMLSQNGLTTSQIAKSIIKKVKEVF